ncbi:peptidoglycan DD-metalloendopeptidase family protein [Halopseudomonas yangmingensis]|uniref:Murein DD-endopeptidase MepM and murein hydrolase activator NlpD, contain LysM domain n=1 Tax=Halopseudomonas yangmingensis TaxID=1720063 RepID=A0A1I4TYV9_9GAMM|nr:peptidoglycan DD-metalloendopeptidase family protein [Halopseudomonas yangmingensis]SFM81934.1 Murein DD-endopeptidase MepM and murein hydrolase activator NlpD, contain LysM domain [Halopseudomonas yangmingensis]
MSQTPTKMPRYPKSHLVAASGIAAALSFFLLAIPSSDVEAHKTFVQLDLQQASPAATSSSLEHELDAVIGEVVTSAALDLHPAHSDETLDTYTAAGDNADALTTSNESEASTPAAEWISLTVASGNTLSVLFNQLGLSASTLHAVINSSKEARRFTRLNVGQVLEFKLDPSGDLLAIRTQVSQLESIRLDRQAETYAFSKDVIEPEVQTRYAYGSISSSLSAAGAEAGISYGMVIELANIFGYDIDFARQIREGDSFELMFEEKLVDGQRVGTNPIMAARFTNRGKTYTAIRYTDKSGVASYYRADGESMRKAFIRTPVEFARISSRFNPNRRHPVLNKIRAHNGVDYAAPTGTPIMATGDGRVVHVGRKGGYGNTVVVSHGRQYQTLYAHMSRYAKGISNGTQVRQGQVIGYVGMTGLATGPHLHYEFLVNGKHVDPLGVKLPASDPIPANEKTAFMALSNRLVASMDSQRSTQLAMLDQ